MKKNSVLFLAVLIVAAFVFAVPGKIRAQQLQETEPQETELQTPEQPASEQTETEETEEQQDSAEPGKVSGLKLNNSQMRQMTVTWQAVEGAAGYQVRYSYYKDFVRYKTAYVRENKAVLKKLKVRKKCYVMVRAYKGTKKAPIFGEFSAVKKKTGRAHV